MHAKDAKNTYSAYYAALNGNPAVPELFIIPEVLSGKVQVCLCPPQCQSLQRELVWQQAPTSGVCKAPCSPVIQTETHTEGQAVHPYETWASSQMLPGCKVSMTPGLVAPGTKCNRHFCPQTCMPIGLLALPSAQSCWFVVTHFIVSIWASFLFFPLCPHLTQLSQGVCQNFYKPAYTSLSEEDANHKTTENAGTQNLWCTTKPHASKSEKENVK